MVFVGLCFFIFIGFILRLHNLSQFKIYPDSYQSLTVAHNIQIYHSVVGYLGQGGLLYPDYFMWTRSGYPLLINLLSIVTKNTTISAEALSFVFGLLVIVVAFFFIKSIFKSPLAGVIGSLFIALSFNLTVWGGFIMTETVGIFFLTSCLFSLFTSLSKKTKLSNPQDFLTGLLFTCAVLTRYEYAVMIFPIFFICISYGKDPKIRLINICSIVVVLFSIVFSLLFPMQSVFFVILSQLKDFLFLGAGVIGGAVGIFILFHLTKRYIWLKKFPDTISKIVLCIVCAFVFLLLLQLVFGSSITFLYNDFSFVRHFLLHDFLISIFSILGMTLLLLNSVYKKIAFFCLFSLVSLGLLYHKVNPDMERYMTHLIPFLLIPASYALWNALKKIRQLFDARQYFFAVSGVLCLFFLFLAQGAYSYMGLRYTNDSSWFEVSYEETAATQIKPYIPKSNPLLIASLPESYYYDLHVPTQSIADTYPFIFIHPRTDNPEVLIIVDMPMHEIFPRFTTFVTNKLPKYKIVSFYLHKNFHYTNMLEKERYPVVLYKLSLQELQSAIRESNLLQISYR